MLPWLLGPRVIVVLGTSVETKGLMYVCRGWGVVCLGRSLYVRGVVIDGGYELIGIVISHQGGGWLIG